MSITKWTLLFGILFLSLYTMATTPHHTEISQNSFCPLPRQAGNKVFFSQYFEDYILSIVFSGRSKGTYVDVGAASPYEDSVTNYFYLKGWHGINIEPLPAPYQELVRDRPRDINVNLAISDKKADNLNLYHIYKKNTPKAYELSTFNQDVLSKEIKEGYSYETLPVKVKTLDEVLNANNMHDITFLKIDVEGKEKDVLKSINLKKYRPQVILIESLIPHTHIDSSIQWQDILLNNDYIFITFDGLNSYYIAKEDYDKLYEHFLTAYNCTIQVNKKYHVLKGKMDFSADFNKNYIS